MDIISVSHFFYPRVGGLEKMAYLVLKHLSDRGYSCISIYSNGSNNTYKSEGFTWKSFKTWNLIRGTYPIFGIRFVSFIFKTIRKNPNAVVLIHDRHLLSSVIAAAICRILGRDYILISHTIYSGYFKSSYLPLIAEALDRLVFSRVVKGAKRVICVSRSNRDYLIDKFYKNFDVPHNKFSIIFNTYNDSVKKHTPLVKREKVAVFASKLISVKDPDTTALAFLSLAREFPDWKFIFVGEGETILKTLDELPVNLEYIPRLLDQATLHDLLSKSAIYVNSSLQEGLSTAVIEAAILGNELVLSDAPSNIEILELARATSNSFTRGDVINLQNKLKEKILELQSVKMIREDTLRDEFLELCSQNTILSAYEDLIKAEFATKEFRSRLNLRKAALTYEE
jgi:glycosyltransferase involved in cell wall biosynthesis